VVIALLVGAAFMILFVLAHLAREFSRLSFHSPPDLGNSDDWDCAQDDFDDTAPPGGFERMHTPTRHPRTGWRQILLPPCKSSCRGHKNLTPR
jgi:hypothetical protein